MRFIWRHIMPLVINNLGGGHTDTDRQTHIHTSQVKSISRYSFAVCYDSITCKHVHQLTSHITVEGNILCSLAYSSISL